MEEAPDDETEEEAEERRADYERRHAEHEADQERREYNAELERDRQARAAELERRQELSKARNTTLERIIDEAPVTFSAEQFRAFLRLLIQLDPYSFLEDVVSHFAGDDENARQTEEEIVLSALNGTADDELTGFALRLALTDFVSIPRDGDPDCLAEAEAAFASPQPDAYKPKKAARSGKPPELVKSVAKKATAKKRRVA